MTHLLTDDRWHNPGQQIKGRDNVSFSWADAERVAERNVLLEREARNRGCTRWIVADHAGLVAEEPALTGYANGDRRCGDRV